MKNLMILSSFLLILSCGNEKETSTYAKLSGKITNPNGTEVYIQSEDETYTKVFKLNADGSFSDTLNLNGVTSPLIFSDGNEMTRIFLKNGFDITLNLNTNEFDETITYEGLGAENNTYLAKKMLLGESIIDFEKLISLDSLSFQEELSQIENKHLVLLNSFKNLDTALISFEKQDITMLAEQIQTQYTFYKKQSEAVAALQGKDCPTFENYISIDGKKVSLKEFKGKYIYMDIWATWCAPCKAEIPALKEIEKEYHDKNIVFMSISVDDVKDEDKWKQMVQEKELKGVQLFADNSWKSTFIEALQVKSIPRFILVDPTGKIIDADAPRPSEPELKELLKIVQ